MYLNAVNKKVMIGLKIRFSTVLLILSVLLILQWDILRGTKNDNMSVNIYNNKVVTMITIQCLWWCYPVKALARVHPIRVMNAANHFKFDSEITTWIPPHSSQYIFVHHVHVMQGPMSVDMREEIFMGKRIVMDFSQYGKTMSLSPPDTSIEQKLTGADFLHAKTSTRDKFKW